MEYEDLLAAIHRHRLPDVEQKVMILAERFRQEGIQEGLKLGVEKTLLALDLIKEGKIIEEIAKETGISLVETAKLCCAWKEKIKLDATTDDPI